MSQHYWWCSPNSTVPLKNSLPSKLHLPLICAIQSRVVLRFWSTVMDQEWFDGCPCWVPEVQTRRRRVAGGTRRSRGCTAARQKRSGMWWRSHWCSPHPAKHQAMTRVLFKLCNFCQFSVQLLIQAMLLCSRYPVPGPVAMPPFISAVGVMELSAAARPVFDINFILYD